MRAHHYGLTVSDLERALDFYRDTLGLEEIGRSKIESDRLGEVVGVEGVSADMAFLDAEGFILELFEYHPAGDRVLAGVQTSNDVGAHHLAFQVEDADEVYEDLSDEIDFINPPQVGGTGAYVAYLHDPDGNTVEIIEGSLVDRV